MPLCFWSHPRRAAFDNWRATASLNYRWNKNWTLHAGYRALHVDYRKGRFLYDTTMHDPILAVIYQF